MFRISDFARLTRVSIRMLRHYDAIGLLAPARVDARTGYRYYAADQLPRLNRILALKDLGFPLDQIGPLLGDDVAIAELRGMLTLRGTALEQRVRADRMRLAQVEARLSAAEHGGRHPSRDIVLRQVPTQRMATIRRVVPTLGRPIERLFDEVEAYAARHRARASSSPLMLFHDALYREKELDIEVAVPVLRPCPASDGVAVRDVRGAPAMACAVFTGGYDQTGETVGTLRAWADAHDLTVEGAAREVYVRFGADGAEALRLPPSFLTDRQDRYVTEIQLPVSPRHPLRED